MEVGAARELLLQERTRLERILDALHAGSAAGDLGERGAGELSSLDQHQADAASDVFEREVELSIVERVVADLADVEAALERVGTDTFGRCESCGTAIPDERLESVPATRYCADHRRQWELSRISLDSVVPILAGQGESIDDLMVRHGRENFDALPDEDEPVGDTVLGPEEAAMHESREGSSTNRTMSGDEIERAEQFADDEQAQARAYAEADAEAEAEADEV